MIITLVFSLSFFNFAMAELPSVSQGFRLRQGLQLDSTCTSMINKWGANQDLFHQKMQNMVDEAEKRVANGCAKRYPELNIYINQWKTQLQSAVILCGGPHLSTIKEQESADACRKEYWNDKIRKKSCSTLEKFRGFSYPTKANFDKDYSNAKSQELLGDIKRSDRLLSSEGKGVIALSEATIYSILKSSDISDSLEVFTHEMFHLTSANNRHDHNEIETLTLDESDYSNFAAGHGGKRCDNNVTKDRVVLTTGLCLDSKIKGAYALKVPEALNEMRATCGERRACIDAFSKKDRYKKEPEIEGWNEGIEDHKAASLCQKIFFEGSCMEFASNEKLTKIFMQIQPYKLMTDRLLTRAESFLADSPYQISKNMMKLMLIDTGKSEDDLRKDRCLSQILIQSNPSGVWALSPQASNKFEISYEMYRSKKSKWESNFLNSYQNKVLDTVYNAMKEHPYCQNQKAQLNFLSLIERMKKNSDKLFNSDLIFDLYNRGGLNTMEKSAVVDFASDSEAAKRNQYFIKIMGEDVVLPYLKARSEQHFRSPHFDCASSPARDNVAYFNYEEFVRQVMNSNAKAPINCP